MLASVTYLNKNMDYLGKPVPEGQTILDLTEAEMIRWQWHQLNHVQVICTSFETDSHESTSSLNFKELILFLPPNQQRQSVEG